HAWIWISGSLTDGTPQLPDRWRRLCFAVQIIRHLAEQVHGLGELALRGFARRRQPLNPSGQRVQVAFAWSRCRTGGSPENRREHGARLWRRFHGKLITQQILAL